MNTRSLRSVILLCEREVNHDLLMTSTIKSPPISILRPGGQALLPLSFLVFFFCGEPARRLLLFIFSLLSPQKVHFLCENRVKWTSLPSSANVTFIFFIFYFKYAYRPFLNWFLHWNLYFYLCRTLILRLSLTGFWTNQHYNKKNYGPRAYEVRWKVFAKRLLAARKTITKQCSQSVEIRRKHLGWTAIAFPGKSHFPVWLVSVPKGEHVISQECSVIKSWPFINGKVV